MIKSVKLFQKIQKKQDKMEKLSILR
jgi:hypothetical protein